ncbi:hypothetical protein B9Z55_009076 [Caenorhabditis nigoni]|uniref:Zinc finger RING-type eukaryotic domain-containing protein n=1 Tax=Caenorhabditis nigoni TaxID=1611254 RepID=A0A2G5UQR3_9PELO|nr:hypothetical protein B9Z55_009076 [Caenorhabditis nigoni]
MNKWVFGFFKDNSSTRSTPIDTEFVTSAYQTSPKESKTGGRIEEKRSVVDEPSGSCPVCFEAVMVPCGHTICLECGGQVEFSHQNLSFQ